MKKLKKLIRKLWYRLFPKKQINQINKKLLIALKDKAKERINLSTEIKNYLVNELKIDKKSKFIPLHVRRQVCTHVMAKFGKRMIAHKIKMNINLELVAL